MFAGDEQYLGYSGYTWRVGDITAAWAWGFLAGGVALVVLAVVLAVTLRRPGRGGGTSWSRRSTS